MAIIAVAGFQHETNTFASVKAGYDVFARGGAWPPLVQGEDMLAALKGQNLPAAGFVKRAKALGHDVVPILWTAAEPSAEVTKAAYEKIAGMILDGIMALETVDAVYLDLHGAMVAEHADDGEGELLRRLRDRLGPDIPVVASLDLHANVTSLMVESATLLDAFRTYPHIDMAATGVRCATLLNGLLRSGRPIFKAFRQVPFLIPIPWQCTDIAPAKEIYRDLQESLDDVVFAASFCPGFPLADIADCGPTVVAYGFLADRTEACADHILDRIVAAEEAWNGEALAPEAAIAKAMAIADGARKPVILADVQDNAGGGGESDTTGLLRAMASHNLQRAAIGLIADPVAAAVAHEAGVGKTIAVGLGGKSGVPGDAPFDALFRVDALGDGKFTGTGPFYKGSHMDLGPMACLSLGGLQIAICSVKAQLADLAMLRHVGIEPTEQAFIGIKSSVHFRADFAPIAEDIIIVVAPGSVLLDTAALEFQKLRPDIRRAPGAA